MRANDKPCQATSSFARGTIARGRSSSPSTSSRPGPDAEGVIGGPYQSFSYGRNGERGFEIVSPRRGSAG